MKHGPELTGIFSVTSFRTSPRLCIASFLPVR